MCNGRKHGYRVSLDVGGLGESGQQTGLGNQFFIHLPLPILLLFDHMRVPAIHLAHFLCFTRLTLPKVNGEEAFFHSSCRHSLAPDCQQWIPSGTRAGGSTTEEVGLARQVGASWGHSQGPRLRNRSLIA